MRLINFWPLQYLLTYIPYTKTKFSRRFINIHLYLFYYYRNCRDRILACKIRLKDSDKHKTVYISPDRSPEERDERRKLVAELKERKAADPEKTFGIRGGKVMEMDV